MASFGGQPERLWSSRGLWYDITHDPMFVSMIIMACALIFIYYLYKTANYIDFMTFIKESGERVVNAVKNNVYTKEKLTDLWVSLVRAHYDLEGWYWVPPADTPKLVRGADDWYRRFDIKWYAKWQRRRLIRQRLVVVKAAIAEVTAKLRALGVTEEEFAAAKKEWIYSVIIIKDYNSILLVFHC